MNNIFKNLKFKNFTKKSCLQDKNETKFTIGFHVY